MMKFEDLKLKPELLQKAKELGFEDLTEIQEKCTPEIHKGMDVVGQAETGSGKTLAFGLPILDKIIPGRGVQTLVLTPTRELCVQVADVFKDFGKPLGIRTAAVYGGVGLEPQVKNMQNSEIIVGTPGRILDHLARRNVDFRDVCFLVLDEADKMFEMGFIEDVERIISRVPKKRQTMMFSATISYDVHAVLKKHMINPLIIKTHAHVDTKKLHQAYYEIYDSRDKFSLLVYLLKNSTPGLAIVFCATRGESDIVASNLKRQGVNALAIHGGMSQHMRLQSLDALKNQTTDVLVATDVAARGLDIKKVSHVYNYDVPKTSKEYVHRIGRTARAGESGDAVTLLVVRDHDNFRRVLSDEGLNIERKEMPQFPRLPFSRRTEGGFGYGESRRPYSDRPSGFRDRREHGGRSGYGHRGEHRDRRANDRRPRQGSHRPQYRHA
jgi:ATP-dependent RNA helicase DeaD